MNKTVSPFNYFLFPIKLVVILLLVLTIVGCSNKNGSKRIFYFKTKIIDHEQYGNWLFYKNQNTCFIYSYPISSYGSYTERNRHYIMINFNPSNQNNEIEILGGLPYVKDSTVRIQIEDISYLLVTIDDEAWATQDAVIINKMLNNNNSDILVFSEFMPNINRTTQEHQSAVDKYSLIGFHEAYEALQSSCNNQPQRR